MSTGEKDRDAVAAPDGLSAGSRHPERRRAAALLLLALVVLLGGAVAGAARLLRRGGPLVLDTPEEVNLAALSRDGRMVAVTSYDGTPWVCSLELGLWKQLAREEGTPRIFDLEFSADGASILALDKAGFVRVWRTADGALEGRWVAVPDHDGFEGALSPRGNLVAAVCSGSVELRALPRGELVRRFPVAASRDRRRPYGRVMFAASGELLTCWGVGPGVWACGLRGEPVGFTRFDGFAFAADAASFACCRDSNVELREIATGQTRWRVSKQYPWCRALPELTADGERVAIDGPGVVEVRSTRTGQVETTLAGPAGTPDGCGWLRFDERGERLATLWDGRTLAVFDLTR